MNTSSRFFQFVVLVLGHSLALKQGIADNRLRVGLWASSNGYIKSKRKIQGKVITVYSIPQMQFN